MRYIYVIVIVSMFLIGGCFGSNVEIDEDALDRGIEPGTKKEDISLDLEHYQDITEFSWVVYQTKDPSRESLWGVGMIEVNYAFDDNNKEIRCIEYLMQGRRDKVHLFTDKLEENGFSDRKRLNDEVIMATPDDGSRGHILMSVGDDSKVSIVYMFPRK